MSTPTSDKGPNWKFWHPLSFWRVLLIFAGWVILSFVIVVVLRELFSVPVPIAAAGAAGGLLGVLNVSNLARKQRGET